MLTFTERSRNRLAILKLRDERKRRMLCQDGSEAGISFEDQTGEAGGSGIKKARFHFRFGRRNISGVPWSCVVIWFGVNFG